MSNSQAWFYVGRAVSNEIPAEHSLRPTRNDYRAAATKLGITVTDAEIALGFYNFGAYSPPAKPAPVLKPRSR